MKPIIGIVEWPYLDKDEDVIYEVLTPIIEWVVRSGGRPIGIFPTMIEDYVAKRLRDIREMTDMEIRDLHDSLSMCDAIIKPGAIKIYDHERKIYDYALKRDVPYLGICAGMQIMAYHNKINVQNERNNSHIIHHSKEDYAHKIYIGENTKLHQILGKDEIMVNSRHNFHISDTDLMVSATAEDGIIEAIEHAGSSFNLGVQWHPELLPKDDENSNLLFNQFIEEAKRYQKRK